MSYQQASQEQRENQIFTGCPPGQHHAVQFYESEAYLCTQVGEFLVDGMRGGNPIVVIARPENRHRIVEHLRMQGFDMHAAVESGQFIYLDAHQTLAALMDDELPNEGRFTGTIGGIIKESSHKRGNLPVFAFGEMVDILWREGKHQAAMRLEELWNGLAATHSFKLLCAYAMTGFYRATHREQFEKVCSSHSQAIPTERVMGLSEDERLLHMAVLEQRAVALEGEIEHRKTIEKAQAFLSSIVESAEDAIVSKTLDGIVTSWNPGAEKLFGYTAEEMIGRPIMVLIPQDQPDEEPRILERLRRGERIEHYETHRVRKDGSRVDISLTVSPIKDETGRIIGASKIARDITDRKRIEAERNELLLREREARAEAEAASRMKDEFLAILSHELRTPLSAILGWTSILSSRREEDLIRRAVDVIHRNASMQKRLIEDLLDMARILSGKMVIESETVDLALAVNAAIDSVGPAAMAKTIQIDLHIGDSIQFIRGDADRLQQIVWNLLSNAIKFTPQNGCIEVRLQQSGSHAEISVRDTGPGIPRDFLPHIFERFRQADSSNKQHGGLGLGLAIVRHLVEAHGGTVSAESAGEGQGSVFVVRLPALLNAPEVR